MKNAFVISVLVLLTAFVVLKERHVKRPSEPVREGCVFCHDKVSDPDPSHPVSAFGCYSCHLGNPYSLEKERAHASMVRNPGDLRVVDWTCGKGGCHSDVAARVKNSLMATNRGILKSLQRQWLKIDASTEVSDLLEMPSPRNRAIDHYRKLCAGCHLWKKRGDRPGEVGRRGGGCSDCHVLDREKKGTGAEERLDHSKITTRIPSENCVKCHNRSARIGLSYFGEYESAGYGTPYAGKDLSDRRLSGNRFYLRLSKDVHFKKWGMECVDCHTGTGLMGDGKKHDAMKDQVDVTCKACHEPRFSPAEEASDALGNRLIRLNKKVPDAKGKAVGVSKKGAPLYNLQKRGDKVVFYRKLDGRPIEMDMTSPDKAYHRVAGHDRLSCQACHSAWMPQCYGCHLTYRQSGSQKDWITGKETPGSWKEKRSYMRASDPTLGVKDDSTVFPVSPCQVFLSSFDQSDRYEKEKSFKVLGISAFDPHTTSTKSRPCLDCHGDPKTLGLGEGILRRRNGDWVFRPTYDASASGLGIGFSLDSFVDLNGRPLQGNSLTGTRPFNKKEMDKILFVGACVGCHNRYDDEIYRDFQKSKLRFEQEAGLPCRK